jgi:hypothetical protein
MSTRNGFAAALTGIAASARETVVNWMTSRRFMSVPEEG